MQLLQPVTHLLQQLDAIDVTVVLVNLVLIVVARPLMEKFSADGQNLLLRVYSLRLINLLIIAAYSHLNFFENPEDHGWSIRLLASLLLVYIIYLLIHVIQYWILRRFGRQREVEGKLQWMESYNSRMLSIIATVLGFVIGLVGVIQVLGFDSLLHAGGVIGFIGVLLALTQSSWAPDIFSGLIILNSDLLAEGDVVELRDGSEVLLGVVFKTKMFHSEILNLVNNHRIMVSNSRVRGMAIHNLSRFASARGLRENLHFKIGYDVPVAAVKAMFNDAFAAARENHIAIEDPIEGEEIAVADTGDHAIEWEVFYYTKEVRKLLGIRQQMREIILQTAQHHGISLATPTTISATMIRDNLTQQTGE